MSLGFRGFGARGFVCGISTDLVVFVRLLGIEAACLR